MTEQKHFQYDVFISNSPADRPWVESSLLPRLKEIGLRVCTAWADFEIGAPTLVNSERAVDRSRHTLIVMTPDWLNSQWNEFEALLTSNADPAARQRRLIPLLLKPCQIPPHISMINRADFSDEAHQSAEMTRLLRSLGRKSQVFISYKRNVEPDESLMGRLRTVLEEAGHRVFIDQKLLAGVEWAREIHRQIEISDFVLVLLSKASVQSEMVAEEVAHARQHSQVNPNKARLIPIHVDFDDPLSYPLSHSLETLQHVKWGSPTDDEQLFRQLLDAIGEFAALPALAPITTPDVTTPLQMASARAAADPRFIEMLSEPGGALRAKSEFYVTRSSDDLLLRELGKSQGTTTTIRAPRQTGKSSLLIRAVAQAQQKRSKIVYVDLQPIEPHYLQSLDEFLRYFATLILTKLRLDPALVDKAWQSKLGAPDKLTYLLEDHVLSAVEGQVVLALDEVDRLLQTPFQDTFFGLLRAWHNSRALNELWEKLDIVMVISTEPHLLIADVNQSPFNVGQKIRLQDFDATQVRNLNSLYRNPVQESEIESLMASLNGHPYLTHKALYTLTSDAMPWSHFAQSMTSEQSVFGDHLRRYLWLLRDKPDLRDALKRIIRHGECGDEVLFYRLQQAGLIQGSSRSVCSCRCKLYEAYFRDKLI